MNNSRKNRPVRTWSLLTVLIMLGGAVGLISTNRSAAVSGADVPRVNAPNFGADNIPSEESAIFWFAPLKSADNHTNVRVGYNDEELKITVHVFDRRLWFDSSPTDADLTNWDAVTFYLHAQTSAGNNPTTKSYRVDAQLNQAGNRDNYQAFYQGDGAAWVKTDLPFIVTSGWRGTAPNDSTDDRGWLVRYRVPFSSLGLSGPPAEGTTWRLGLYVHDRDDSAGSAVPEYTWPEDLSQTQPNSWGELVFGLPEHQPASQDVSQTVRIRHGLRGNDVPDAHVGGHSTCGDGLDFWTSWGEANYAGFSQINIQNQWDLADFPCFSRYYVTFPLDDVPDDRELVSAKFTMHLFGNAGPAGAAVPSWIQVLAVDESWQENTINWNNAPLAAQNISGSWVDPVGFAGGEGVEIEWDVSVAVAEALANGTPLRLALYSADGEYHSGKYFWSSDAGDGVRPELVVRLGDPAAPGFTWTVNPDSEVIDNGEVARFKIRVTHDEGLTEDVQLTVDPPSNKITAEIAQDGIVMAPGGTRTMRVTDVSTAAKGAWYDIPVTASVGTLEETTTVRLLVGGSRAYLPLVNRGD